MSDVGRLNINIDERDELRVNRLSHLLGLNRSDAVRLAIVHMLATVERGEPTYQISPSELGPLPSEPAPADQ
jgi:hypothetical protein